MALSGAQMEEAANYMALFSLMDKRWCLFRETNNRWWCYSGETQQHCYISLPSTARRCSALGKVSHVSVDSCILFQLMRTQCFCLSVGFFGGGGVAVADGCRDDLIFMKEHQSGAAGFTKTPISLLCVTCHFYQYLWPLCCLVLTYFVVKSL